MRVGDDRAAAAAWFERFVAFGRTPSPDNYAPLFHPEGLLQDAGAAPIAARDTGAAIAQVLAKIPDARFDMRCYRHRANVVFVEAHNSGTLAGHRLGWDAVYRVHLRQRLVYRGMRFHDHAEMLRPLLGPQPGFFEALASISAAPDSSAVEERFDLAAYRSALAGGDAPGLVKLFGREGWMRISGCARDLTRAQIEPALELFRVRLDAAGMEIIDSAGDSELAFVEWKLSGWLAGQPLDVFGVDRLQLADGRIVFAQRYFDTLSLIARSDPAVAAIRASVIAGASN